MESHGGNNQSGPQRHVPSFFNAGSMSQGGGTPEPSAAPEPGSSQNSPPKSSIGGLSSHQPKNPYQMTQPSEDKALPQQFDVDPFAKSAGSNLWQQIKERLFPEIEGVSSARQKAMVILVPVLAIVMIFVFRQVLSKAPQETEGALNNDAPVVSPVVSENDIDWKVPEPMPVVMRDPIKLAAQSTLDQSGQAGLLNGLDTEILSVRGILYSDDKPSAVIGNKIVHLNEMINGAKVVKIDKDYVVFEKDGKRWTKKVAELNLEQDEQEPTGQEQGPDNLQSLEEDLSEQKTE